MAASLDDHRNESENRRKTRSRKGRDRDVAQSKKYSEDVEDDVSKTSSSFGSFSKWQNFHETLAAFGADVDVARDANTRNRINDESAATAAAAAAAAATAVHRSVYDVSAGGYSQYLLHRLTRFVPYPTASKPTAAACQSDNMMLSAQQALSFMNGIMDEVTHLKNYPVPVDTSLVIAVCAEDDAYVPLKGMSKLDEVWPGAQVRYVKGGHVRAYVQYQKNFR